MYFNTAWQFEMIKRGKEGHGTWYKCTFQNSFSYFQ